MHCAGRMPGIFRKKLALGWKGRNSNVERQHLCICLPVATARHTLARGRESFSASCTAHAGRMRDAAERGEHERVAPLHPRWRRLGSSDRFGSGSRHTLAGERESFSASCTAHARGAHARRPRREHARACRPAAPALEIYWEATGCSRCSSCYSRLTQTLSDERRGRTPRRPPHYRRENRPNDAFEVARRGQHVAQAQA